MRDGYQSLLQITGVGEATADSLYKGGFGSAREVAESNLDELGQVSGITPKKAEKLIESAKDYLKITQPKDPQVDPEENEQEKTTEDKGLGTASVKGNEVPVE